MKKPHIRDYFTRQFIAFLACNAFAAGVNFGSRMLFSLVMRYEPAIFFAYCCGILTAFTLNKLFVFDARHGKTEKQLFGFVIVNILGLTQVYVTIFNMNYRIVI